MSAALWVASIVALAVIAWVVWFCIAPSPRRVTDEEWLDGHKAWMAKQQAARLAARKVRS